MSPPFVEEHISRRRDLSLSLLLERAVCLLKEKGEKAPGVDFWVRVKIPAHMFVATPSAISNISHAFVLKQLVELDVEPSVGFHVVEGQEFLS